MADRKRIQFQTPNLQAPRFHVERVNEHVAGCNVLKVSPTTKAHLVMSYFAGTGRDAIRAECADGLCHEKQLKEHGLDFPGSWSDVSRGALFEMDIERASPKSVTRLGCPSVINIAEQFGEGCSQRPCSLQVETGNIRSNHELDKYGQAYHLGQTTNEVDNYERSLDAPRNFTQRETLTCSIPIPNIKSRWHHTV
jgi:hypothetical protein